MVVSPPLNVKYLTRSTNRDTNPAMRTTANRLICHLDEDDFPLEILKRRRRLKLSQIELAEVLGLNETVISQWERGSRPIPYPKLVHCALVAMEQLGADAVREQIARGCR